MAIQATSEEQLRLKKRARQRLLGAATLLISAAIILPLVLDKAPRPLNSDIAIDMPAPPPVAVKPVVVTPPPLINPPVAAHTVPENAAVNHPVSTSKPAPAPVMAEQVYNDTSEQNNLRKENEAKSALAQEKAKQATQQKAAQLKLAHEKALAQQTARAEEKAKQAKIKPSVNQPPTSVEAKSDSLAPAITDSKHRSADANSQYVVQLGAFSSPENVRQLRERLSGVGVNTYTENLPSGAIRVRAGPFAERGQADNVLAKISAAGVQAQVIPLTHK